MRPLSVLALAGALAFSANGLSAQTPQFAVEVRGGYAIPTGDFSEDELFENGLGVGATVTAMVSPQMGIYAGWEMFRFSIDEEALGVDADADGTDAGFRAGLASFVPLSAYPNVTPFTELGVVFNTFEISASDGDSSAGIESDAGLGYEAGVGVAVQVGPRLQVTPSVRYRQHEAEFDDFEGTGTVSYFAFGVGLRLRM